MKNNARPLPAPRQILTDSVYEAVKELVMDQHIEPGARVNIDQLARDLKVSPTPVREALARLEMDGLVIKEPLRGYSIAPILDAASFEQLYEVRGLIEPFAARRAAERADRRLVTALQREVDAMTRTIEGLGRRKVSGYRGYRDFAWQDARFHEAIASASGNELLGDTILRLRSHLHLYRLYYATGIGPETVAEHSAIVKAIAAGQPENAAAAMAEHIRRSQGRQRKAFAPVERAAEK